MGKISLPIQQEVPIIAKSEPSEVGVQIDNPEDGFNVAEKMVVDNILDNEDNFDLEIKLLPLKKHFDIDINDTKHNDKLSWIMEWAKLRGIWGRNKLMEELRSIEYKIGMGGMEDSRIVGIYRYLVADNEAKLAASRVQRMEANANRYT